MKLAFFALIFSIFSFVPSAFAQQFTASDFSLNIIPENPRPGETVTAELQSFSVDIDRLAISWSYRGTVTASGTGKKTVQVIAGAVGSKQVLEAIIRMETGAVIKKSVTIAPSNIDLLWESVDSYVPPFYKGKPLPASEGMVRVTVFPERASMARNYSYIWSQNGTVIEKSSGYGKIGFLYQNEYLNPADNIDVTLKRADASTLSDSILVPTFRPLVAFYRKTVNGFTQYERQISAASSMQKETELYVAEPFYFSVLKSIGQTLAIDWKLGGQAADPGDRPNELTLSRGADTGSAEISVSIKNPGTITQFANNSFRLNF